MKTSMAGISLWYHGIFVVKIHLEHVFGQISDLDDKIVCFFIFLQNLEEVDNIMVYNDSC